jgi:hypothetical protein
LVGRTSRTPARERLAQRFLRALAERQDSGQTHDPRQSTTHAKCTTYEGDDDGRVRITVWSAPGRNLRYPESRPVVISFLVWRVEGMPVALVILLSAFIGIVFASLSGFAQQWRLRSRVRQLESQVKQLSATATEVQRGAQRPSGDSAKL